MTLFEKRFHKYCQFLRGKKDERNSLKGTAAKKKVKLDVIIGYRAMRRCYKG